MSVFRYRNGWARTEKWVRHTLVPTHRRPCSPFRGFQSAAALRAVSTPYSPPHRLNHDEPLDCADLSSRAFQALCKPDVLLEPTFFSHPLPHFRFETDAPTKTIHFENGNLWLWNDQDNQSTKISGRWLRDNCSCPECRNIATAQRQINVLKGTMNCDVEAYEPVEEQGIRGFIVTFGDGHRSAFREAFLFKRQSHDMTQWRHGMVPITTWTAEIETQPPSVSYSDMLHKAGMGDLLRKIRTWGFSFIDDMPPTPEATKSLLESIGPIRNTHYGAFYDFTSDLSSKDTAYTSEHLDPHTDNTYFTEPAGLQALHLLSHTEGSGGASSLVDGFGAALRLYVQDREAYTMLSGTGVHAHASGNEGISIQPTHAFPTLNHDREHGFLTQVRWNNADRAGVAAPFETLDAWYDAAGKFEKIVSDVRNQYWFQLRPGRMLVFDNWRVLHGREAFTGKRRMCGGYIGRDDYMSRFRMTNLSEEEVRASTVTG